MQTLRVKLTNEQAKNVLRQVPAILAGKHPDSSGVVSGLLQAMGVEALSIIRGSFIVKSRGGTDAAGIQWSPLSRNYLAYGRRHPGVPPAKQRGKRFLLTDTQDKLWRITYVRRWHSLKRKGIADGEAKAQAASHAWVVVKAAGGKTLIGEYGNAPHEIGRDTGRLLNSLSPGVNSPDQVLQPGSGFVSVGTNVAYAEWFHLRRPLWPSPDQIPEAWTDRIGDILKDGVVLLIEQLMRGYAA